MPENSNSDLAKELTRCIDKAAADLIAIDPEKAEEYLWAAVKVIELEK
jgi:hypothetical protein